MVNPNLIEINEIQDIFGYIQSIDWNDRWLYALIGFHVLTTAVTLATRKHGSFQIIIFLGLLVLVYCSESINEYAAENWKLFSKQQYFDSKGFFISIMFSMPILLNCMLLIGTWLYQSFELMTSLKTMQLKKTLEQRKRRQQEEESAVRNEDDIIDEYSISNENVNNNADDDIISDDTHEKKD